MTTPPYPGADADHGAEEGHFDQRTQHPVHDHKPRQENTMTIKTRRVLAMSLATALTLSLVLLITASAGAEEANTCKDLGYSDNLEASTSGVWGSVTFDNTAPSLTLVVAEGFEVKLCIKAGSVNQGLGPEETGWLAEGTHVLGHTSGKELSHYGLMFREVPDDDPTTTAGESTTTQATTTTVPGTTTTDGPTTTGPEAGPAEWAWGNTCDTISVTWGEGIVAVDFHFAGSPEADFTATSPGTFDAVVGAPMVVTLVPIADGNHFPTPDGAEVTVEPCPVPTEPGQPTTPAGEGVLPFTGGIDPKVAALGVIVGLAGLIALAVAGRTKPE